jgi:hypothetical protein
MNIVKLKEKTNRINFGESLDKQIGLAKGNISVIGSVSERMDGQEAPKNFDSIPDVWFHALSYELALMDGSLLEDFRLEYEKNWRAIFASVCLSEILCIKVETERLSFKGDNLTLQGIAKGFIPHGSYFGDQTSGMDGFAWDSTVRYFTTTVEGHEINIALSSPSTIIVPAPDAFVNLRTHFPDQIPWLSDLEHSVVFSENSVPSMTESQAGDLAQFIHDYRHYLLQYVDESGANSVQRMLLNPLGKAPGAAGLLLRFEQDLVKTYNLSKLADGIFAISGFSCMSDIIASESFFLFDIHVYQLDSKTAAYSLSKDCIVVHSVEIDKRDYTIWAPIPVSKKGFEALKGADGWKIEYKHESTGAIIKELRLTLTLTKGNKKTVLSKIYATDKIHSEFDTREMCSAGIWPSRNYDGWSKYYLTTAYGNQNSILTFVPVLETDQYTTYPFEGHTTYIMHKFPQYLCAVGKNDIIIGYVPLLFDNVPWTKGGDALVASIDFGTSSTVIYIKGNPNKKITDERELCAGAIMSACPEGVEPMRGFLFPVWSLDVPFATKMRVSQKDDTNRLEALVSANILFPLLGASLDEFTNKRLSNNPELPHNIIEDDMKWGGSEKDKKLRSLYFQIIFQQLLLAARIRNSGGLELRISYPTALSAGRFGLFKGALNETKDKAIGNTLKEYTIKIDYMSEGQAAAQQIASNVSTRRCVVDIGGGTSDIFYYGRHKDSTTGREVYRAYDTSVRFAARDIIVRTMYYLLKYSKGTDMLSAIANANSGDFSNLDELKRNLPEFTEFQREFEDLLNQRSRTIAKRRGELYSASVEPLEGKGIGGVDKQEWRKFTSILTMCVAAVVHTAGMVARHSKDSGTRLVL